MVERLIGPLRVRRHGAAELAALAVFIAHASIAINNTGLFSLSVN